MELARLGGHTEPILLVPSQLAEWSRGKKICIILIFILIQEQCGINYDLMEMPISCTVEVLLWNCFKQEYSSTAMCIFYKVTDEVLLIHSLHKFSQFQRK
jgi:hypothetical protein